MENLINPNDKVRQGAGFPLTGPGLVHIYCGDGKGKTTCGMGLCCRAAGFGYKVLICQFMKDNSSSERKALTSLGNVTFVDGPEKEKFSFLMTQEEKAERRFYYNERLRMVAQKAVREKTDVLFLDEVLYAIDAGLMDESLLVKFLDSRPRSMEVILTGRNPGRELTDRADYISEIRKIKHPYDHDQPARNGIEK